MTAPAYATDLADIDLADALGTWVETGTWTQGAAPALEADFFIQGSGCAHKIWSSGGSGGTAGGSIMNSGGGKTIPSPGGFFAWLYQTCPNNIDVEASGGLRLIMGSSATVFGGWKVRGRDTYILGGWICCVVDPAIASDYQVGGWASDNSGTKQWFGGAFLPLSTAKSGFGIDALRYGRGELRCEYGATADGYATFSGAATKNDANDASAGYNRWGLFSAIDGGYLQQGLFLMGTATYAVDFRDSNKSIVIANTKKVVAAFNLYEVRHASSRVDWTNIVITALGTVSKGSFLVTNNADVNKDGCVFTDMDYFTYQSNSTILNSTYRRCGLVTQGGAVFTNCIFENASGAVAIKASNPSAVTGCKFTSDGSNHAMEATTAGDYDWNNTLVGYATSDGSGGNEAFYNNSGGHINLTVVGGTRPYVKNGTSATTDVIIPDVTLTISAPVSLVGAEIRIYDMDDTLPNLGTELAGTETHNAATYAFSGSASNVIWIQIMLAGYEEFGQEITMPSASGGFTALLKKELNA